jgi:hypothetical protein
VVNFSVHTFNIHNQRGQQMSTPTTKEAIEYARKLTPDCWSDEVIKVLFLEAEKHSSAATHYLRRAEKAEADCERFRLYTFKQDAKVAELLSMLA